MDRPGAWVLSSLAATVVSCAGSPSHAPAGSAGNVQQSASGESSAVGRVAEAEIVCDRVVDDFAESDVGRFPSGWRPRDDDDAERVHNEPIYVVEEDGERRVLHAVFLRETVTIARLIDDWKIDDYPILEWEWKAVTLPTGGDETDASSNDTGAAIYAIWEAGFPFKFRGIKYAWSSTLPVGTRYSKRFGYDQLLVVESGPQPGAWRKVRVNVRDHYLDFFDTDEVPSPSAIALMTDADATGSRAEALYANIRLCRIGG